MGLKRPRSIASASVCLDAESRLVGLNPVCRSHIPKRSTPLRKFIRAFSKLSPNFPSTRSVKLCTKETSLPLEKKPAPLVLFVGSWSICLTSREQIVSSREFFCDPKCTWIGFIAIILEFAHQRVCWFSFYASPRIAQAPVQQRIKWFDLVL